MKLPSFRVLLTITVAGMIVAYAIGALISISEDSCQLCDRVARLEEARIEGFERDVELSGRINESLGLIIKITKELGRDTLYVMDAEYRGHLYSLYTALDSIVRNSKEDTLMTMVQTINGVIMENPQKAMSVPLLTHDMVNMQKRLDEAMATINKQGANLHELTKWFVGLAISIVLCVLGLIAAMTQWKRNSKAPQPPPAEHSN